ncbi:MAG TPA: hypothetical protein VGR40_04385 [Candidatus Binatus sp.]|nr:hypothetical protein [Candidatus Binatus sp.]
MSTAGVHPLVRASMLPRIKAAKVFSPRNRNRAMAQSLGPKAQMSVQQLKSSHSETGRKPRA